jgi:hypothetical protein
MYNIPSVTNSTLLTADMIPLCTKKLYLILILLYIEKCIFAYWFGATSAPFDLLYSYFDIQSQSQNYFTTGGLPPISSSWRQTLWDSRPAVFYIPRHWVSYSSRSTTRRATVEVFEPASARGILIFLSQLYVYKYIVAYRAVAKQRPRSKRDNTTAIFRQQLHKDVTVLESLLGSGPLATVEVLLQCFLCDPPRCYITRPTKLSSISAVQCSAVQWSRSSWLVSELGECCGSVLVSCCCQKLRAEVRSGTAAVEVVTRQWLMKTQLTEKT